MSTLQLVHYIVAASCFAVAAFGMLLMLVGIIAPRSRRRIGDRLFKLGVAIAITSAGTYLLYAAAAVVTVLVRRS